MFVMCIPARHRSARLSLKLAQLLIAFCNTVAFCGVAKVRKETQQCAIFGGSDHALDATVMYCTGGYILTNAV
ncbi:hypothetical protein EV424DRAFT_1375190 [Suillus variegatus]|nr:hypothetical protein EV424DRAFT_1375190 [Suillus variegatus]